MSAARTRARRSGSPAERGGAEPDRHTDDITALAAQWLAEPAPPPAAGAAQRAVQPTTARDAFADRAEQARPRWPTTARRLHLAMVEMVTNAIEHATPGGAGDHRARRDPGQRRQRDVPDHRRRHRRAARPRRRGPRRRPTVAGYVVDKLLVNHRCRGGTTATPCTGGVGPPCRPRRPGRACRYPAEPSLTVDTPSRRAGRPGRRSADRSTSAPRDLLARRLLSVSRGGTVPLVADLTGVTQLASAGVRVLYQVSEQLTVHGQELTLVTVRGSAATWCSSWSGWTTWPSKKAPRARASGCCGRRA